MDFPKDEYEDRWSRVYAEMERRGYATLVVWQRSGGGYDRAGNVWWLAGYASQASGQDRFRLRLTKAGSAHAALLFHERQEPELHVVEPIELVDLRHVAVHNIVSSEHLYFSVATRLRELSIGRVAYVGDDMLPAADYRMLLAATPGVAWAPEDDLLNLPALVKSPRELDVFREAGDISSRALTTLMEGLIQGQPESEAAAAAASIIIAAGGGFQRVCAHHGSESEHITWSDALYGYTTEPPRDGDMVRGWVYGPIAKGYWVDPGRSAVCGNKPTHAQREAIESCLGLIDVIVGAVRVGSTPRKATLTIEAAAREIGYYTDSALFFETYGHGLGTFFSHPSLLPGISADSRVPSQLVDEPFQPGQVMTAEAFLRRPGVGNATFEDVFIVTDDGPEMLTSTPRVFW